jgi:hypothetical protein
MVNGSLRSRFDKPHFFEICSIANDRITLDNCETIELELNERTTRVASS